MTAHIKLIIALLGYIALSSSCLGTYTPGHSVLSPTAAPAQVAIA